MRNEATIKEQTDKIGEALGFNLELEPTAGQNDRAFGWKVKVNGGVLVNVTMSAAQMIRALMLFNLLLEQRHSS